MLLRRRDAISDPFAAVGCTDAVAVSAGGSSVVYRARQLGFERDVAVKVLTTPLLDDRAQRRFERELALSGRLSGHPNVVTVHASGALADRRPYVIMDFCSGGSLADRLARSGPLPVPHALAVTIKLAGVLELAAQQGILHRDVKPGNILITRFGEPALSDFGIAVVAEDISAVTHSLTPVHAAPEVLERQHVGPGADQWSLASTLHTLLSGRPPFAEVEGEGLLAGMLHVLNDPVPAIPRADVPGSLMEVLERALAKAPADRWPSTGDFGRALQGVERAQGWGPTALPIAELEEGLPGSLPSEAVKAPVSTGPGVEGNTQTWNRRRAQPSAASGPPTVDPWGWSPAAHSAGPLSHRSTPGTAALAPADANPAPPPAPPRPDSASGWGVPPVGEATEHFARPRPAPPPAPPESPRPRVRARTRWAAVGVTVILAAAAVAALLMVGTDGHHQAKPPVTFPPTGPRPVAQVENESAGTATISWSDPACSSQCLYVQQVNNGPVQTVSDPTRHLSVVPVKPGTGYTIVIGAVYEAGVQPAWSQPVCVAGCYQGPSSGSSSTSAPGSTPPGP